MRLDYSNGSASLKSLAGLNGQSKLLNLGQRIKWWNSQTSEKVKLHKLHNPS